ncbi:MULTISPECIES: hypothetical protein [unclassified Bosea (in: a-proteobacteria)]|uniref:hypothetical protein n=1 Tax=unclassified Bosea (in: a-proteobacteria) TaxID=2653178 RepID=UPI00125FE9E2|nr:MULTISPECIES: hypothetical protein [unclassified Bosea (in: a-proteobacteria)]
MLERSEKIGLEAILDLSGTGREAKAYAFLYAAFKRTEISKNPVRDVLDCLTPFSAPYINSISGRQITSDGLKDYLKTTFGFDIPLYAIDQLMPTLQKAGYVEYNRITKRYISKKNDHNYEIAKAEIDTEFDDVVEALASYARRVGFTIAPPSGSWGDALIQFLKSSTDRPEVKFGNIKGALLDPAKIEFSVIGAFIKDNHHLDTVIYKSILNVFMGVLVEEFIASVSEVSAIDLKNPVHVFFDTSVILRLLGCSGKLLKTATDELTRYLQDLGFKIFYLSGNESEVAGILETIIYVKDTGREIEGETADAIASGDVNITDIRMLQNTFAERLAAMGIFPAADLEKSAYDNAKYQIDERGFSEYLKQNSVKSRRGYTLNNRENDAGYLGAVMRLRRRLTTNDLASCGYLFVTSNKFLANMSRRYLVEQKVIRPQHCPPVLSVGQVATILWLIKDKALEPQKAGRELLSNCYAAFRPDQQWFRFFREGIEKTSGNIEEFVKAPRSALALQAARRIAQEESFGESSVVRELNMAEILSRAEVEISKKNDEQQAILTAQLQASSIARDDLARQKDEEIIRLNQLAEAERLAAVAAARSDTTRAVEFELGDKFNRAASRLAERIVKIIQMTLIALFSIFTAIAIYFQITNSNTIFLWMTSALLAVPSILGFADVVGVKWVQKWFDRLRSWLVHLIAS